MNEERIKVLVADDEEVIRSLFKRILEDAGYEVSAASSGREALRKMAQGNIQVVLLDINMPEMSGIEVLERLSDFENRTDYCVIMVTAIADMQTAVDALKLGAYDYITKPIDREEITGKIQEAIKKRDSLAAEQDRYHQMNDKFLDRTHRMQDQFNELVASLAREHALLHQLAARQRDGGKEMLSRLPEELRGPKATVEEFRDALLRILRST